jgi:cytochrome c oxidase subunit 3
VPGTKSTESSIATIVGTGWPQTPGGKGSNGNGRKKWFDGRRFPKGKYKVTTWILLAAVVMMFVALGGSYIFLSGNEQWKPIRLPKTFFVSTGLILASSITLEKARRRLQIDLRQYRSWLTATLLLGFAFVASQLIGWRQLVREGVYLSSNPHTSFFYLFSGGHGLHLMGGMMALTYLTFRSRKLLLGVEDERRSAATEAVCIYWHFMDGLWIALFLLLWLWN